MGSEIKKTKKKDKKPLYLLVGFLLFFSFFVFLLTRPSTQSKALKELEICFNVKDVEMVWYKYKAELYQDDEFLLETRKKLTSFNLGDEEIKECIKWLPPAPLSINLIIVPDLSRRIIDSINNPNQIQNDLFVLRSLWKAFVENSKLKQDLKSALMVDVTDIDQAKGQFSNIADSLQFDLSTHRGKSNRLYFTPEKDQKFDRAINSLYTSAKEKPLGADYRFYIRRYLGNHLKKPTLFDNIKNKVVIITDGYLEAEGKPADTKLNSHRDQLRRAVVNGNVLDVITLNGLNIPKVDIDLSNTEVMICEVNERRSGKGYDFEILKTYWEDWFKRMNSKKILFFQREQANNITENRIRDFIKN